MRALAHDFSGVVHLVTALLALGFGTLVLAREKGTRLHRITGYMYLGSMSALNGTALLIYRLFDGWGPFHYAALLSMATLLMGFLPAFFRMRNWIRWHVAGMYYSVIGLYAAFVSEIVTRIPGLPFGLMTALGSTIVMIIGVILFNKFQKAWLQHEVVNREP